MGFMQSYSKILVTKPGTVLISCCSFVILSFLVTLYFRPLESFDDPYLGFQARGTPLAAKINAWRLLSEENNAKVNNLSLVPNSQYYDVNYQYLGSNRQYTDTSSENSTDNDLELPIVEMSTQDIGMNQTILSREEDSLDDYEDEYYQMVNASITSAPTLIHYSLDSGQAFCGKLYEGYAQVVVSPTPTYSNQGLFNVESLLAICQLDHKLRLENSADEHAIFKKDCEQYLDTRSKTSDKTKMTACCNSWTLPNHIACLSNKTSCMQIDAQDLRLFEQLMKYCAPYYYKAPYEECFNNPVPDQGYSTTKEPTPTESLTQSLALLNPSANSFSKSYCGTIPDKCSRCNGWIYNVLHYLTSNSFIKNRPNFMRHNRKSNNGYKPHAAKQFTNKINLTRELSLSKLNFTNLFLPIAKSSSLMNYYDALSQYSLETPFAQVKVLNLGLKNSLFEHLVSNDIKLLLIALVLVLLIISIYTWSLILATTILLIICLSICLSYTIYAVIFNIPIFPFMNLLAVVISFGICSDNAMLFCKQWTLSPDPEDDGKQPENSPSIKARKDELQVNLPDVTNSLAESSFNQDSVRLDRMLSRAIKGTSAATLATAFSFMISAISQVTAVRCFCVFATLSVISNYLLTILLLPPALIFDTRLRRYLKDNMKYYNNEHSIRAVALVRRYRIMYRELGDYFHQRLILRIVIDYKLYFIITFITIMICASILVFRIGLQPADEDDIRLLSKSHRFEQYDRRLKRQFEFERTKHSSPSGTNNIRLFRDVPEASPIRIVFGIRPADNGNHFDPQDRGHIIFDPKFNFTNEKSQIWLLDFCHKLKQQRFIQANSRLEFSSCFVEAFKSWMEARPCNDPIDIGLDRSPCCQDFEFPYSQFILDRCMGEAINEMRKAPHLYSNSRAGIRFFQNSTKVAAVIIEYSSNRKYIGSVTKVDYFNAINDWIKWHINNTAPQGLRSGWFISNNLDLMALQNELDVSTNTAVILEIVFAMISLSISTRSIVLTIAGTLTIGTIIFTIIAILVLLKWTLGVTESILISLTIGLSIDFALHYTVAYSDGARTRASVGVIQRILSEVGSPITLAAITTFVSGFVIIWSDIFPYQELGVFMMLIAVVSWIASNFFLLPILATVESIREISEQYFISRYQRALKFLTDRL